MNSELKSSAYSPARDQLPSVEIAVVTDDPLGSTDNVAAESWLPLFMARASHQWSRARGWSSDDLV